MSLFRVRVLTRDDLVHLSPWRYPAPYDIYNLEVAPLDALLAPSLQFHGVWDEVHQFIGYCCFGAEARVTGGDYPGDLPSVVDVGFGMRPELAGQGLGHRFLDAILAAAEGIFSPTRYRATILEFNARSRRTFAGHGFAESGRFTRPSDGRVFVQVTRPA